ncbi:MAG: hypothetical protein ACREPT_01470 [Rudaea sp.]
MRCSLKLALAVASLFFATGNSLAADTHATASTSASSDSAATYYEPVLIYFMVRTQTTDTSTPVEVNNLDINTDLDDDDLNAFYSLVFNF